MNMPSISNNTKLTIQLGLAIPLIAAIFYAGGEFTALQRERTETRETLEKVNVTLATLQREIAGHWTYSMMKEYAAEMQAENPELNIPSVPDIRDRYVPYVFGSAREK